MGDDAEHKSVSFDELPVGSYSRRITPERLSMLKQRRRAATDRSLRGMLPRRSRAYAPHDSEDESADESEEEEMMRRAAQQDQDFCPDWCCCCSIKGCVAFVLLLGALVGWSVAISMGIMKEKTYEDVARPLRIARRDWLSRRPKSAEEGFALFDRDADGLVTAEDVSAVALMTTGERPTEAQLRAYIGRADTDGDGAMDETEYLALLKAERAAKAKGEGGAGDQPRPSSANAFS